ncbi:hypothetical protein MMPV_008461 [Pyropia vietnamensis]
MAPPQPEVDAAVASARGAALWPPPLRPLGGPPAPTRPRGGGGGKSGPPSLARCVAEPGGDGGSGVDGAALPVDADDVVGAAASSDDAVRDGEPSDDASSTHLSDVSVDSLSGAGGSTATANATATAIATATATATASASAATTAATAAATPWPGGAVPKRRPAPTQRSPAVTTLYRTLARTAIAVVYDVASSPRPSGASSVFPFSARSRRSHGSGVNGVSGGSDGSGGSGGGIAVAEAAASAAAWAAALGGVGVPKERARVAKVLAEAALDEVLPPAPGGGLPRRAIEALVPISLSSLLLLLARRARRSAAVAAAAAAASAAAAATASAATTAAAASSAVTATTTAGATAAAAVAAATTAARAAAGGLLRSPARPWRGAVATAAALVAYRTARQAMICRLFFPVGSAAYLAVTAVGVVCCFFRESLLSAGDLLRLRRWGRHWDAVQGGGALARSAAYTAAWALPVGELCGGALAGGGGAAKRRRCHVRKLLFATACWVAAAVGNAEG